MAAAFANSAVLEWMRWVLPFVNRLSGALLIVVGLYVGYYGVYEVRLFHANGNPVDPLVNAARSCRARSPCGCTPHGAWPWILGDRGGDCGGHSGNVAWPAHCRAIGETMRSNKFRQSDGS